MNDPTHGRREPLGPSRVVDHSPIQKTSPRFADSNDAVSLGTNGRRSRNRLLRQRKITTVMLWSVRFCLKRKIAIYSDEDFELFFGECEKVTVFDSCPSYLRNGVDVVTGDFSGEPPIDAFIE